jgi:3-oxoacyl-[acyl-carrier protein] reductase
LELGIKNKTAFVGGGSKGIGKACALQLAREGVNVAICARGGEVLKEAAQEIADLTGVKALPVQADLSKIEDVRRAVKETLSSFGSIDILIANSGGPKAGKFADLSEQDWDDSFKSVLYYIVELYRLVIPGMKEKGWGRIINIVSLTVKEPSENMVLSNVFRVGVVSLAKSLVRELIASNITINNICPAAFRTDRAIQLMQEKANLLGQTMEEVEARLVEDLPLKRFNSPEELGNLALFMASDLASGITGTTVQIDGGLQKFIF